jgi:hypothetical protein
VDFGHCADQPHRPIPAAGRLGVQLRLGVQPRLRGQLWVRFRFAIVATGDPDPVADAVGFADGHTIGYADADAVRFVAAHGFVLADGFVVAERPGQPDPVVGAGEPAAGRARGRALTAQRRP